MKKYFSLLVVLVITIIVVTPRFYNLASQPPGLHIDEVSFAADAKAISETGRDTWGVKMPIVFKAFGEWKAPGLTYSMAFWSKILGRMDNFVARLPSAIAGLTTLVTLALTLRYLYPSIALPIILIPSLILAFSPWHFDMSRIFYEAFSALAVFAISMVLMTKATLDNKTNLKIYILIAALASLAGYYYASIRYVVLASVVIFILVQKTTLKSKFKYGILMLIATLVVGAGWVADLSSERGLNRLYYYQQKTSFGAGLEVDDKRQFCYLSFARDENNSKWCYLIWNKPVEKITTAIKTYATYLGTDYLFIKAESEYGFDNQFGAYLYPIIPLYLIGLLIVLRGTIIYLGSLLKSKENISTPHDRVYTIFAVITLVSLLPAAVAGNINMRMSMIALYIIAITIGIGLIEAKTWLEIHLTKLWLILFYLAYTSIVLFYIIQSLAHYFLVFTHSNDLAWTSDAGSIFGYVKSVSANYDHIVDTELHGPLATYFYGDISTTDVQNGEYSPADKYGFTYLIKAGKYELRHIFIKDLACEKFSNNDKRKTLVISKPVEDLASTRVFAAYSWNKTDLMHEVYDLEQVIEHEIRANPNYIERCGPKSL